MIKFLLAVLLVTPCSAQWRAEFVGKDGENAINENFRRASIYSNRKLDRFGSDSVYGQPIFINGVKFGDGTIQNTAIPSTSSFLVAPASFTYISSLAGVIPSTATGYYGIYVASANYAANGGTGGGGGGNSWVEQNFYSFTNGTNVTFNLSQEPTPNSLRLSKNGVVLVSPSDYGLSGQVITMVSAPASSTTLIANYAVSDSSVGITTSSNTWTSRQTFTGSVSVSSLTIVGGGITGVHNSSSTILVADFSTTQTAFSGGCVTNSTITITTNGNSRIMVGYSGSWYNSTAGELVYYGYKLDGVSYSANKGIWASRADVLNVIYGVSFTAISGVVTAGSHSICLDFRVSAGTGHNYPDGNLTNQFWIQELR